MQHIDGSVQDSSISSANALELLQSCTKPSIWVYKIWCFILATMSVQCYDDYEQ